MDITVPAECTGQRLDQFLVKVSGLSRSQITQRIRAGDVHVDGLPAKKAGQRVTGGAKLALVIPPGPSSVAIPESIPLDVVYEDAHLIVVNKSPDMVVHPSPGHESGTLVNALLGRYEALAPDLGTEDGRPRPGIVHRLDRGTSGLLVVARDVQARDGLSAQIAARSVGRRYLAIIHGPKLADEGTFDTLHGRHPRDRKRFTSRVREGRRAVTHWKVLARARTVALVECRLETGRTHQIRVHFADDGHPLVGDTAYAGRRRAPGSEGAALKMLARQALHAWALRFEHPVTGEDLQLHVDPPSDMRGAIEAVFGKDCLSFEARS
jgi:23S rRNA pseudouridine1911/1915/1917 synthase